MTWQLLIFLYLLLGAASYMLQRRLGQTLSSHKRLVNGFFFLAVHYPVGLLVASFVSPHLAIGWTNVGLLLIGSWIFPLANLMALRASKDVDAGSYAVLSNLTPIVTILAASLLLNERLSDPQLIGAALILASTFLATVPRFRRGSLQHTSALAYAIAGISLLGLATVYERYMLTRIDLGAYLVFGWGAQALWTAIATWPERENVRVITSGKHFPVVLSYALTNSLKGIVFVAALKLTTNTSLLAASTSFLAILVVVAGYFILNEKRYVWYKAGAAVLGTIGLIVLNIFGH